MLILATTNRGVAGGRIEHLRFAFAAAPARVVLGGLALPIIRYPLHMTSMHVTSTFPALYRYMELLTQ